MKTNLWGGQLVNGDTIPIRDNNWGGSGTQLIYQAVEMAVAAGAGAAIHEVVPLHSWAILVLYSTKTQGSSIQGKVGMVCHCPFTFI
jgi:hypothetical protein